MVDVKTFRIFTIIGWEGFIGSEDHRNSIDETTSAVRKGGVFMSNHSDTHPTPIHAGEGTVGAAAGEPMKKSRILVIDDEEICCQQLSDMLQRLGYEVSTTTNGIEALEAFRTGPTDYDMVITDQTMPRLAGLELADHLRQIRPDIAIILCTGYTELISAEEASLFGIRRILMKPVTLTQLKRVIEGIL